MPFNFDATELEGLVLIKPAVFHDERGYFIESYKSSDFIRNGIVDPFVQDNHSRSKKGVLRGLHYQTNPNAQGKLVRVVRGAAWDIAVDIRSGSPTFKKWLAIELSHANNWMLYIPPGFAHGFLSLTDDVHLAYKCTAEYSPAHDAGIRWNDPDLAISWPIADPQVSGRDAALPLLRDAVLF